MTDLSTEYLGLRLSNPIIVAANPLTANPENVSRMAAAGAAAVVLPSIFEEQITPDRALANSPDMRPYNGGPKEYLAHLKRCRSLVSIPIIASLNGASDGPWLDFAAELEKEGADAIELNAYSLATYPVRSSQELEDQLCRIVGLLSKRVRIPVAVKLHPFYTSLPHLASRLADAGARGLVLFNRFYYPDVDLETMRGRPTLFFSDPTELPLRLRWTAILNGWLNADIAVTGGVHSGEDVVKALMVGARVVQCASALLLQGIGHLSVMRDGLQSWLQEHHEASVRRLVGRLSRDRWEEAASAERIGYLHVMRAYALTERPLKV